MSTEDKQSPQTKPVHELRIGAVKAVIWANPLPSGVVMHNIVPVRIYRDEQDAWQESHSFGRDDLLVAAKVLDMAHTWVVEAERQKKPTPAISKSVSG